MSDKNLNSANKIKTFFFSDKNTSVTVVLDGLECTRFDPKHLIFNCKNVTQDQSSERLLKINIKFKMNFGRPVIRPTVSTLLNEGNVRLFLLETS